MICAQAMLKAQNDALRISTGIIDPDLPVDCCFLHMFTLPFKKCWDDSKFRRTFTLKALKNMHLILTYQIGQSIITMKFLYKTLFMLQSFSVAPQHSKKINGKIFLGQKCKHGIYERS